MDKRNLTSNIRDKKKNFHSYIQKYRTLYTYNYVLSINEKKKIVQV